MFGAHDYLVGGASVVEVTTHEVVGEGCGSSRVAAGELVVYGPKVDHDDHYVLGVGGASRKQPARERSSAARM